VLLMRVKDNCEIEDRHPLTAMTVGVGQMVEFEAVCVHQQNINFRLGPTLLGTPLSQLLAWESATYFHTSSSGFHSDFVTQIIKVLL